MEFCDKCSSVLIPQMKGKNTILVCRKCGQKKNVKDKSGFKLSVSTFKKPEKIVVVDRKVNIDVLPKTDMSCPKCDHGEAFWWMQQTRASDEPPTRFYRCCKCGHTWREYS
ncbi:MAG: transcription factor S [Nanoarchaeota archaeon]|nr:transcription factor S [Nanoarchaeota archaeon]MBU4124535.1 transcription factor S [Nanoarchaeota archaeon]